MERCPHKYIVLYVILVRLQKKVVLICIETWIHKTSHASSILSSNKRLVGSLAPEQCSFRSFCFVAQVLVILGRKM
jgi:hypothetical protein